MSIDFKLLVTHLQHHAATMLPFMLPGGKFDGNEYLCSDIRGGPGDSLRYNFVKQTGKDFASGETFGDMINLYARIENISMGDSAKKLHSILFGDVPQQKPPPPPPPAVEKPVEVTDICAPPSGFKTPNFKHAKHGEPSNVWTYRNLVGDTVNFILRYNTPDGKQFSPLSWSESQGWVKKQFPEPRMLYGLEHVGANPDLRVIIVEGEKAADALRQFCGKNYIVVTWPGGANAWNKVDWSPLRDRKVLIWPDRDFHKAQNKKQAEETGVNIGDVMPYSYQPGTKAAAGIAGKLFNIASEIKVLNVEDVTEAGFDAADALDAGWDTQKFLSWARERVVVVKGEGAVAPPPDRTEEIAKITEIYQKLPIYKSGGGLDGVHGVLPFEDTPMPDFEDSPDFISASMGGLLPDQNKSGKPLSTLENMEMILEMNNITVRYNVIKKVEEILIPDMKFSIDNAQNASLSYVVSKAAKLQMPLGQVTEYVSYIADQNPYNPIATWIKSKPWDGQSRLKQLYDTIQSHDEPLKEILMYRWLVSAVAAAFEPQGVVARGVLVFQGLQYLGKTMWFKSLVPAELEAIADGMILKPDDKDSVKQIVSYWLVELGELDATFKKSDISQLKAFISKQRDKLRAAYARKESEYARRTVFFASVNPDQFLHDETGNTRYWTVQCDAINHSHGIDMQQLWAEVYEQHYLKGVKWMLTAEEMARLNESNEIFMSADPVEEALLGDLDWNNTMAVWNWKTATEALKSVGIDRPTKADVTKAGLVLRKKNSKHGKLRYKREGGVYYHFVPGVMSSVQRHGGPQLPPDFVPQRVFVEE